MFSEFCLRGGRAVLPVLFASLWLSACGGGAPQEADNRAPAVAAGEDQTATEGSALTFAGSATDPDGDALNLQWTQTSGPLATLDDANSATLRLTAPQVNADAELQFTLTATDAQGASASDTVLLRVTDIPQSNRVPVVNAGLDQSVNAGSTVALSGAASDEDGTVTSLAWQQVSGPAVTLRDGDTASASFDAPAVAAPTVLGFTLTATDNAGATGSDAVNITVQPASENNRAPVADAGPDLDLTEGTPGELLGSGRDEDGRVTRFQWRQLSGPNTPLSDAGAARPSFTAPPVSRDTELQFELVVSDDVGATSAPDTVRVTVRDLQASNQPPVVSAGSDVAVDEGAAVTLTGSASDADGEIASRAWTQISGADAGPLTGADSNSLRFTAPAVSAESTLVFRFTATDNDGATASDTVSVLVRDLPQANQPPSVSAGPDQQVDEATAVALVGSASDADGTVATLRWTQTSGAPLTLQGADTATLRFTAPAVGPEGALFGFRLSATDNNGATASDTVEVRVRDTAVVAAACAPGQLCVGSARRSITPRAEHIAGVTETRLGGQSVTQRFHLGGFGFGPIEAFGPFNDFIANDPAARASHCPGLVAECADEAREHTWVRAFYLSQPGATAAETVQTLFITLDAVGAGNLVQKTLTEAIAAETGVPASHILVGQTHTHAGADLQGLWGGVPQDWVQNVLRAEAVVAAKTALLNARAAELQFAAGRDGAFNNYRRPRQTDPDADTDDQLAVLQARDSLGGVLGTLVQYAAHPTAIGTGSGGALGRVPHADYPLGLEDVLESRFGATAIYYNGAIADASGSGPAPGSDDYARVRARGACLAQSVLALLDDQSAPCEFSELGRASVRRVSLAPMLSVRQATATLPVTNPVFLAGAAAGAFNRYYDFLSLPLAAIPGIGPVLASQQTNLPQIAPIATTAVSRITIGGAAEGLEIVTLPGEATNTFGQSVRRLAASPNMMLFGLTHNSFGYIIPEEEYSAINPSGDAGFIVPFTGYEEFVSLGPLTAPLLRLQAYNPLFDVSPSDPANLPPTLGSCATDPNSRQCLLNQTLFRIDTIQRDYANACRASAPAEGQAFCALLDPDTPLAGPCRAQGGPDGLCAVLGNAPPPPPADADGDGVADADDQCPDTAAGTPVDAQGCPQQSAGNNASCTLQQNLEGNRSYQVTLPSASGETISFQVLEPSTINCAARASGAHPLILQGHGFGGARNTTGFANYRELGYAVISIDQRGFGDSTGTVRVMDPDFEGRDLVQILDWAEQNLDYLAWRDEGSMLKPFVARPADAQSLARGPNLLVGAIGSSYGGGYQFLLQNVDAKERLDAMAPDIAWHDLRWSLNPGDVIKTGWDLLLVAGGSAGSYGPGLQNQEPPTQRGLDPYIVEVLARGVATGEFPREALEWFRYHSPSYWCGLNGQPTMPYAVREHAPFDPNVMLTGLLEELPGSNQRTGQPALPVLISQGMKDTLFNFNDAWWNYQCMATRGDDVRLITHQSGHLLPLIQAGGNNDCGGRNRGTATVQWFAEKLRGSAPAAILRGTEEALCLSLADGDAVDIPFTQFLAPRAANSTLPALEAGYTEVADVNLATVPQGAPAALLGLGDAFNQQAGQAFPLPPPQVADLLTVRAGSALILAGIAQAEITLRSPQMVNDLACATAVLPTLRTGCDAMVFVGLGLKKAGTESYTLIDDQVLPLRGLGSHSVSLVGVGERLAAGDTLALLAYGYHPQYLVTVGRDPTLPVVQLEADLALPLYTANAAGEPDFAEAPANHFKPVSPTPPVQGGQPLCAPLAGCLSEAPLVGAPLQALVDTLANAAGVSGVVDTVLASQAAEALLRGCDVLDPAHCLYPFPSDHFTVAAAEGSVQSEARGGTGRRVNFPLLAMPRNVFGKGIDPTEWNRNDGFSPGSMLITYVPGLDTLKNASGQPYGPVPGAVALDDLRAFADDSASVIVLDAETGARHPVWAEIDLNAGQIIPSVANEASPLAKRPALIVRPASNFVEGRRYVAVLRQLQNEQGAVLPAQSPFALCRDGSDTPTAQLPPLAARCAALENQVFPVLAQAGIERDENLYLAWDFTIASAENQLARLRHLRDDAFADLGEQGQPGAVDYQPGRAPAFVVNEVSDTPDDRTIRRIRGTVTIPSYVVPADPSPLDGQQTLQAQLQTLAAQCQTLTMGNCGVPGVGNAGDALELAASASLPPNRLLYLPTDGSPVPDPDNAQDPTGLRYGDGLPDRNPAGDLTATFTCNIPRSALPGATDMVQAAPEQVRAVRPTVYGHGLLGGQGEVNGQASDFGNRHGLMNCAMDWFGFATGDVPNVASVLVDLSNFPVIPDGSQQGMLNQMFLARLLTHADGFAAHPAFQVQGRPVFDRREVFYHGNSQGGILGGTLLAVSKDLNRGMLGVPGMNYSTLLSRSVDFATYSIPFYLAYPDDLDRPLNFALMQMLWDRSENNGYAAHLSDNTALNGPANQVLLHPGYADHQVTVWSADVMARTAGARVDARRVVPERTPEVDGADYALIEPIDYRNPVHAAGSALVPFDQPWPSTGDGRCRDFTTVAAPIGNVPPLNDDDDPHECPRRDHEARCQMSHFLLRTTGLAAGDTPGQLIDPTRVSDTSDTAAACPPVVITGAPLTAGSYTPPSNSPGADYGSGIFGVLARLGAGLHQVLVALANLDPMTAATQLQTALAGFAEDLANLVVGEEASLVALLTHFGENLAGGDPETAVSEAGSDLGAVVGLDTDPASAAQRSASAAREVEAVVLTGAQLPGWSAVPAQGVPHPYPSGTGLASQCRSAGGPEAFCSGLGDALAGTPLDPEVRSAHNGSFIYPPAYVHGETQPVAGGVPVEQIAAFAYTAEGSWREIPVQVDERFPYFLANSRSDFGVYSGTDEELSYAWDVERWNPVDDPARQCFSMAPRGTPDPVAGLDDDDELVFMARDAGNQAPPGSQPDAVPADARSQLVTLADPLNPATPRFVYLYQRSSGSSFAGAPHYVRYARHADADQWIDQGSFQPGDPEQLGSSNRGYGANLTGTVCRYAADGTVSGEVASEDRFPRDGVTVTTDTYRWTASGRWMVRGVEILKPDGAGYGADVLDRWKGRAFQQSPDSTVSLVGFEDEQVNWEGNSMLLGERCGPVRCLREVWGADSGTNVTKTETFYRDAISYRYHVRVHPIPPDGLYTSWDYNRSAMVPTPQEQADGVPGGRYYTALRPQGVPIDGINDDLAQIDSIAPVGGFCLTSDGPQEAENGRCPLFFDAADPTFNLPLAFANWEQVSAKGNLGSLVYTFEVKGATSFATPAVVPYYRDDACLDDGTGDDPVIRPWPGEASTDARVVAAYTDRNGDGVVACEEKQGAHAAHGIHYFFTGDVDNGFVLGKPTNEIDGLQWQFMVPTAAPVNVGEPYANVSRVPLKAVAVPLSVGPLPSPPGLPTGP